MARGVLFLLVYLQTQAGCKVREKECPDWQVPKSRSCAREGAAWLAGSLTEGEPGQV